MNKRAFEIQFSWLFVLVAGAAILLFFAGIIIKQKNISEISSKATVLKSIEAIITGTSVSTDTTNIISVANSNIEIGCNRVSLGEISKQYQNLILFAPSIVKGDKIITQTLAFNEPYRAINFLFMTSSQVMYILIGSNDVAKLVNKTLPSEMKKDFYESELQIKNSNNYKVKFVMFGNIKDTELLKEFEKLPDTDVTEVRVDGDKEKGNLEFYQKNGNSWQLKGTSIYIGKASLIGAIYADTIDAYECSMQNSFTRLNFVTQVYIDRTTELMQNVAKSNKEMQCNQFYQNALNHLNKILKASSSFNQANANEITVSAKGLADENLNAQTHSCALIY